MRIEELERELRAGRPETDPEFARRLDDWAAAGFPRDAGLGPGVTASRGSGAVRRAWNRMSSISPRRALVPAGSVAVMAVVIGIAISQGGELGSDGEHASSQQAGDAASSAAQSEASSELDVGPAGRGDAAREADALGAAPLEDTLLPAPIPDGGGGIARGTEDRRVDATARITLGAEAEEVQEVANRVVEVTDRHDGIVLDSQVTSDQGGARAAFELEIPYRELDAALTDLSELGDVILRTEAGEDITVRAVRAQRELAGVLERIRAARVELIRADTREERLIVKSRISALESRADALEAELNQVERQARFATVAVEVTSNGPESDEGGWSLGDALDDAGKVLEVIGGIALVSLAVLVPLGLGAALAWLVATRVQRRRRERLLDRA